jgi:hypothetical protein
MRSIAKKMTDVGLTDIVSMDLTKIPDLEKILRKCHEFSYVYYIINKDKLKDRKQSDKDAIIHQKMYSKLSEEGAKFFITQHDKSAIVLDISYIYYYPSINKGESRNDYLKRIELLKKEVRDFIKHQEDIGDPFLYPLKFISGKHWGADFKTVDRAYHFKSQDLFSQNEHGISHTFGWGDTPGYTDPILENPSEKDYVVGMCIDLENYTLHINYMLAGSSLTEVVDLPNNSNYNWRKRMNYLSNPLKKSMIDHIDDPSFKFYHGENYLDLFNPREDESYIEKKETCEFYNLIEDEFYFDEGIINLEYYQELDLEEIY